MAFSLIIEVTTEKVLQFIMPLKSIYSRNFGFIEQKMYFLNTTESFKQESFEIDIIFAMKKNVCWPFQSCTLYAYVRTTKRWFYLSHLKFLLDRNMCSILTNTLAYIIAVSRFFTAGTVFTTLHFLRNLQMGPLS